MSKKFSDSAVQNFGEAISDIRQKLVEEAWFGKPVTAQRVNYEMDRTVNGWGDRPDEQQVSFGGRQSIVYENFARDQKQEVIKAEKDNEKVQKGLDDINQSQQYYIDWDR